MTLAEVFAYPTAGTASPPLDVQRSRALCRRVKGEAGRCFQNSRAALALLHSRGVPAVYVEGFAVDGFLPAALSHAWIEVDGPNGRVALDPTESYAFGPRHVERFGALMQTAPEMLKLKRLLALRRSDWGLTSLNPFEMPEQFEQAMMRARGAAESLIASRGGIVIPEALIHVVGAQIAARLMSPEASIIRRESVI